MQTFPTSVAAEAAIVHQQTVIRWAKEGIIEPSVPRRKWEPRKYTEQDLAALMIVKAAFHAGFTSHEVAEMVKMAQRSDEKEQRNAAIIACNGRGIWEGFVESFWIPNVKDSSLAEHIKVLIEAEETIQVVSFYDVVQSRLKMVHVRYGEQKLAGTEQEKLEA